MRCTMAFLSAVFLLATTSFAQSRIAVEDLAHHPFEADFFSGGQIDLHIRSAEIHIIGNKDIELHAGDLTIGVGDVADYAHVKASVSTGEINAKPFGESHGGLFRSFEKSGSGKYTLVAHVGAGELTLK